MSSLSKQSAWEVVQEALRECSSPKQIRERCELESQRRHEQMGAIPDEIALFDRIAGALDGLNDQGGADLQASPPVTSPPEPGQLFSGPKNPIGTEAVRRIMRESNSIWTFPGLLKEIQHRRWGSKATKDPQRSIEAAVHRLLYVHEEIERVGRGEYRYRS